MRSAPSPALQRFGEDVSETCSSGRSSASCPRGLPKPATQHAIHDEDGLIARVDFAYPELRIVIELDGRRYHGPTVFEADRDQRARLTTAGWAMQDLYAGPT